MRPFCQDCVQRAKAWLHGVWRRPVPAPDEPRSHAVGRWGEDLAAAHLQRLGYRILGRRVRPDRRDEIDIVARLDDTLVFVEVKTRRNEDFGRPLAAVDRGKRHALSRAATRYLRRAGFPRLYYRFDTVEVIGAPGGPAEVRHIENAFAFDRRLMLGS
jgi:putative endonuclease